METKLVVLKAFKILVVCVVSDIKLSDTSRSIKSRSFSNGGTRIHLGTIKNYARDVILITNYDAINT